MNKLRKEQEHRRDESDLIFESIADKLARHLIQNGYCFDSDASGVLKREIGKAVKQARKTETRVIDDPDRLKLMAFRKVMAQNDGVIPESLQADYNECAEIDLAIKNAAYTFIHGQYVFDDVMDEKIAAIVDIYLKRFRRQKLEPNINVDLIKFAILDEVRRIQGKASPTEVQSIYDDLKAKISLLAA